MDTNSRGLNLLAFLFFLVPLLFLSSQVQAQTGSPAVQREELKDLLELPEPTQKPKQEDSGETFPEGPDYEDVDRDVGEQLILREKEPHKYYELVASESTSVPDNSFLANQNPRSDVLYQTQFGMTYRPKKPALKNFKFRGSMNLFRYRDFESLDFNSYRISTNYFRTFKYNDMMLAGYTRAGYERLEYATSLGTAERGEPFLKQYFLTAGLQRYFPVTKWEFYYVGMSARFTSSGFVDGLGRETQADPERDSISLFGGYNYQYSRKVSLSVVYRFTTRRYQFVMVSGLHRRDKNHSISGSISYQWSDALRIGLSYQHTRNTSNSGTFEYDMNSLGANAKLKWKF